MICVFQGRETPGLILPIFDMSGVRSELCDRRVGVVWSDLHDPERMLPVGPIAKAMVGRGTL